MTGQNDPLFAIGYGAVYLSALTLRIVSQLLPEKVRPFGKGSGPVLAELLMSIQVFKFVSLPLGLGMLIVAGLVDGAIYCKSMASSPQSR